MTQLLSSRLQKGECRKVDKTWGYELIPVNGVYCGKLLHFEAGKRCSMHFHLEKDETFYLHSGLVVIALKDRDGVDYSVHLAPGDTLHIPPGQLHQIMCLHDSDADLFEFSTHDDPLDSYRVNR